LGLGASTGAATAGASGEEGGGGQAGQRDGFGQAEHGANKHRHKTVASRN
jgi:hypothetical protein